MSNLTSRILVALVAIPAIFFITYQGELVFFLFVALLSVLGILEYYKLAEAKDVKPRKVMGVVLGFLVIEKFYERNLPININDSLLFISLLFIFLSELLSKKENPLNNLATTLFGVLYVAGSFGTLLALREMKNAEIIIAIFIAIVVIAPSSFEFLTQQLKQWITDSFSWFYVLSVAIFLILLIYIACSEIGRAHV